MLQRANQYITVETLVVGKLAGQVDEEYEAREEIMIKYLAEARWLFGAFRHFTISKVSCTHSKEPGMVKLFRPTISIPEVATTEVEHSWIDEIFRYNNDGSLPEDKATARQIRRAKAWSAMSQANFSKSSSITRPRARTSLNCCCASPRRKQDSLSSFFGASRRRVASLALNYSTSTWKSTAHCSVAAITSGPDPAFNSSISLRSPAILLSITEMTRLCDAYDRPRPSSSVDAEWKRSQVAIRRQSAVAKMKPRRY
ncbi:hypothetical protein BHM03_00035848 [Ensete ventricosum]|nr:hypothetical protein BHM03_00035848 [Ensete ventricosum]